MDSAFKDKDTLAEVQALQQDLAHNAEMYIIQNQFLNGNKQELLKAIHDVEKIADLLERNIQGTITAGDVMEIKEKSAEWSNGMKYLKEFLIGL